MSVFSELKRRNVFKVTIAYLMLSWLILQLVDVIAPLLFLPDWVARSILLLLTVMLPVTLIVTWAFELTPNGIKKTDDVNVNESIRASTGLKINYAIITFLILVIGLQFWLNKGDPKEKLENTIAVMPFVDMSLDGSQEYFGDGIAEEILNVLVSVDELDVISRTSSFSFKGTNTQIPDIAKDLGVNFIVEGSIRTAGDNVRVTAQLIDVQNDTRMWSETFDRELSDIFAIQDEISVAIADMLKVEILGDIIGDVPTQNMEAYSLFLQARHLFNSLDYNQTLKARAISKQIIDLDPNYAEGWGLLSASYVLSGMFMIGDDYNAKEVEEYYVLGLEAASKAISLKPNFAYAWAFKGFTHLARLEFHQAKIAVDQAVSLNPNDSIGWEFQGYIFNATGLYEEALEPLKIALDIEPLDSTALFTLSNTYIGLNDIMKAKEAVIKAEQLGSLINSSNLKTLAIMEADKTAALNHVNIVQKTSDYPIIQNFNLIIDAFYNPELRENYKIHLRDDTIITAGHTTGALLLNDGERFVELLRKTSGVRYTVITELFSPPYRSIINQKAVKDYLNEIGIHKFWQDNRFPSFCRPLGENDFECQDGTGNWP